MKLNPSDPVWPEEKFSSLMISRIIALAVGCSVNPTAQAGGSVGFATSISHESPVQCDIDISPRFKEKDLKAIISKLKSAYANCIVRTVDQEFHDQTQCNGESQICEGPCSLSPNGGLCDIFTIAQKGPASTDDGFASFFLQILGNKGMSNKCYCQDKERLVKINRGMNQMLRLSELLDSLSADGKKGTAIVVAHAQTVLKQIQQCVEANKSNAEQCALKFVTGKREGISPAGRFAAVIFFLVHPGGGDVGKFVEQMRGRNDNIFAVDILLAAEPQLTAMGIKIENFHKLIKKIISWEPSEEELKVFLQGLFPTEFSWNSATKDFVKDAMKVLSQLEPCSSEKIACAQRILREGTAEYHSLAGRYSAVIFFLGTSKSGISSERKRKLGEFLRHLRAISRNRDEALAIIMRANNVMMSDWGSEMISIEGMVAEIIKAGDPIVEKIRRWMHSVKPMSDDAKSRIILDAESVLAHLKTCDFKGRGNEEERNLKCATVMAAQNVEEHYTSAGRFVAILCFLGGSSCNPRKFVDQFVSGDDELVELLQTANAEMEKSDLNFDNMLETIVLFVRKPRKRLAEDLSSATGDNGSVREVTKSVVRAIPLVKRRLSKEHVDKNIYEVLKASQAVLSKLSECPPQLAVRCVKKLIGSRFAATKAGKNVAFAAYLGGGHERKDPLKNAEVLVNWFLGHERKDGDGKEEEVVEILASASSKLAQLNIDLSSLLDAIARYESPERWSVPDTAPRVTEKTRELVDKAVDDAKRLVICLEDRAGENTDCVGSTLRRKYRDEVSSRPKDLLLLLHFSANTISLDGKNLYLLAQALREEPVSEVVNGEVGAILSSAKSHLVKNSEGDFKHLISSVVFYPDPVPQDLNWTAWNILWDDSRRRRVVEIISKFP